MQLVVDGLGRRLAGSWIWQDISLQVGPSDGVGIVGPSGSGKSLFLRALAGLDTVQQGTIAFQGQPLEGWSMPEYRSKVLYLHQRTSLHEGSVEDNLRAVFEFAVHRHRRFDRDRAGALLAKLGRSEAFFQRDAASLSGGESQIVALVRALQLEPCLLLLDEPTASLDSETVGLLEGMLLEWRAVSAERAFLLTSHDRQQVARLCQKTVSLQ